MLDQVVYQAWERGGFQGTGIKKNGNRVIITRDDAELQNLDFEAGELGTVDVKCHFLTKEITEKDKFTLHVTQKIADTGETLGGETYEIRKYPRTLFYADAGENKMADVNEPVVLTAAMVNEPVVYNWYDTAGNLLYEGANFTTSVAIGTKYKLEVISLQDGFKDYDEVEINVKPAALTAMYPNPATQSVTVDYKLNGLPSAYLAIAGTYGTTYMSHNHILNPDTTTVTIDISHYPSGMYSVVLIANGQITDTKTLLKE